MNNVNKLEEGQRHKWAQREKGTEVLDIGRAPDENSSKGQFNVWQICY